jgi:Na+/melibiose symporter-like transporter
LGLPAIASVVATVLIVFCTMSNKKWTVIRKELDERYNVNTGN